MAYQFLVNQTPATAAVAMWNLVDHLVNTLTSNNWTKTKDSDGTTYSSSGTQVTGGGSGANGLDNSRAWIVINQPGSVGSVGRSFCVQRNTTTGANTSYLWRIKYSRAAGFVGGTPSATQVPSATDEEIVLGGGTDASPSFQAWSNVSSDGGFRQNIVADNAAPGTGSGGGFITFGWANGTGNTALAFGLEPLLSTASADTDPYILHINPNKSTTQDRAWMKEYLYYSGSDRQLAGWYGATFYQADSNYPGLYASGQAVYVAAGAMDCWDGIYNTGLNLDSNSDAYPLSIWYWNYTTEGPRWKGLCTMTRAVVQLNRATGDLANIGGSKDGVIVGNCMLPWDGSSTPTV